MKEMYENTKLFILNNYNGVLDENILDILTVSFMSLFIRFPYVTKDKMPYVLNKLEMFFDNKTVLKMVTSKYPTYPTKNITNRTNGLVVRALNTNDPDNIDEEWTMFISTSNMNTDLVNIIGWCVHEFIHLLRFNGIVNGLNEVKVRDGVSVARCNKERPLVKRKHYCLEEGIVEYFAIQSLDSLYEFIKNENVSFSRSLSIYKKRYQKDFKAAYELERFFLDGLNKDKKFAELLEYTFIDTSDPLMLITYYNNILSDSSAFSTLSRELDEIVELAERDKANDFKVRFDQLVVQINEFLKKAHGKKLS